MLSLKFNKNSGFGSQKSIKIKIFANFVEWLWSYAFIMYLHRHHLQVSGNFNICIPSFYDQDIITSRYRRIPGKYIEISCFPFRAEQHPLFISLWNILREYCRMFI